MTAAGEGQPKHWLAVLARMSAMMLGDVKKDRLQLGCRSLRSVKRNQNVTVREYDVIIDGRSSASVGVKSASLLFRFVLATRNSLRFNDGIRHFLNIRVKWWILCAPICFRFSVFERSRSEVAMFWLWHPKSGARPKANLWPDSALA